MHQGWTSPEFVIKTNTDKNMTITGYASVFDIADTHNDIMAKGAFASLDVTQVKLLWQHDSTKPIGIIKNLFEDEYGLFIEAEINSRTSAGAEAIALIKQKAIAGLSVGFLINSAKHDENGVRIINAAQLFEVSIVTFPANQKAEIFTIKSKDTSHNKHEKHNKENIIMTENNNIHFPNLVTHSDDLYSSAANFSEQKNTQDFIRKGSIHGIVTKSINSAEDSAGMTISHRLDKKILSSVTAKSVMRRLAHVETISTRALDIILEEGKFAAGWVAESDKREDTENASLIKKTIEAYEMFAQPKATQSLLNDSEINIENWLVERISDQFTKLENEAFINGDGENRPLGLMRAKNVKTTSISAEIEINHLLEMINNLDESYLGNAHFLMNRTTLSKLQLLVDKAGRFIWQQSLSDPLMHTIFGIPVAVSSNMPDIDQGKFPIILGDFKSAYKIVDRSGVDLMRDPYTEKPFVKFYAVKRVGGSVVNSEALVFGKIAE